MKHFLSVFLLFAFLNSWSQSRSDSLSLIKSSLGYFDLSYSDAEVDSMFDGVKRNQRLYAEMHKNNLANNQPFPFAFAIDKVADQKKRVNKWIIPKGIQMPANKNDLAFYSIQELAALIKYKKISSVELTKFFLDRLKKWGDTLLCVISLTEDIAMQQAKEADEEINKGNYRGPLHGIPYGLKDLFAVKGTKTTWGAEPFMNQEPDEDAFVYLQLKKAGAVLCAKLTLGALAMGDVWFGGRTRTPWDLSRGSSGSSAGSASATVAGLLPFAIGTETLGSIISPANACGATGLRPTFGSVSRTGAMVLCWSLDKIGPLCRSAKDAAIVFDAIVGTDGKDYGNEARSFSYDEKKTDVSKLKVAYASNYFRNIPRTASQWKVIDQLKALGVKVDSVEFPEKEIYPFNVITPILNSECAAAFDELTRSNKDDLLKRQDKGAWPNSFRTSRLIPAVEYINANRHRYTVIQKMKTFMQQYDVLIVPTFAGSQLAITNLTGHPALIFPCGYNQNGLPETITFLGNWYDEAKLLALADAFQQVTGYHKKHPEKFKN